MLIEKGKQLYLEEAPSRRRAGGLSFTHVPLASHSKIPGNERADSDELAARGKANLRCTQCHCQCTVGRFENCGPPRSARPLAETSKGPSCSEIEVIIIRDFESGPGVFADDGASGFTFGSRRDIELGARILYDHCVQVRWPGG